MKIRSFLLLFFFSAFIVSCDQKAQNEEGEDHSIHEETSTEVISNPASAEQETTKGNSEEGVAKFQFQEKSHDFGKVIEGEKVSYSFKFKNTGDAPLVISDAKASCGCTVPKYSKEAIAPGEDGFIDVVYNSAGREGSFNKSVTVIANTIPNNTILNIKGDVVAQ